MWRRDQAVSSLAAAAGPLPQTFAQTNRPAGARLRQPEHRAGRAISLIDNGSGNNLQVTAIAMAARHAAGKLE
jgi:hypothetical protein